MRPHPGLGVPAVRGAGPAAARRAMPRRLAPRPRARHGPGPGHGGPAGTDHRPGRGARSTGRPSRHGPRTDRPGRADRRAGPADHRGRNARKRPCRPAAPPPVYPATAGRHAPAAALGQPADGRQDLHGIRTARPSGPHCSSRLPVLPTAGSASDGAPADPDAYDYTQAARDALHFAALFDRFIQNLRRFVGYDLQYFAAIEPQRRLAPHVHIAIRGTISRAELREVIAATYHQVWWPSTRRSSTTATACRFGTSTPGPTSTRTPARYCPPGTRPSTPSAMRTSRCTWPGSAAGSTPRACSPDRGTPAGASATSRNT